TTCVVAVQGRIHQDTLSDSGGVDALAHLGDHTADVAALHAWKVEGAPPTGLSMWITGQAVGSLACPDVGVVHCCGQHSYQYFTGLGYRSGPIVVRPQHFWPTVPCEHNSFHLSHGHHRGIFAHCRFGTSGVGVLSLYEPGLWVFVLGVLVVLLRSVHARTATADSGRSAGDTGGARRPERTHLRQGSAPRGRGALGRARKSP